jgi:predicted O-methyltransferase YrrM
VAADAVEFCAAWTDDIDLLYLDAEAEGPGGKDIYLRIAQAAWNRMPRGALLLAHNSVNSARAIRGYLDFVRDRAHCRASVNMVVDSEGLEVSVK